MSQQAQPRGSHVSQLLSAYLDNQLNPAERAKVQAHLATCPACAAELSDLQATVVLLARLPAVPLPRSFVLAEAPARPSLLDRLLGPAWGYGALRLATVVAALLLVVLVSGDLLTQYLTPRAAAPMPTPTPALLARQVQPSEALPAVPATMPAAPQAVAPTKPPAPAPLAAGSPAPTEVFKALPTSLPTTVLPTRGPLPTSTPGAPTDATVATSRATATPSPAEPRAGIAALATATPSPTRLLPSATPTAKPQTPTPTPTLSPTPPPPTPTVVPTATSSPTPLPPTPTVAPEAGEAKGPQPPAAPAAPVRGMGELAGLPIVRWAEFGLAGLIGVLLVAALVARRRR
jgi:hypothetical protein